MIIDVGSVEAAWVTFVWNIFRSWLRLWFEAAAGLELVPLPSASPSVSEGPAAEEEELAD